ncbi:MAG: tRNA pseudouridine(55) synthase TruB [Hydrocarboniphaga effusa]|nr:tRNA pseudouridine(55) synthase TruB [Hydrocarboniphaga effusa]
MGALQQVKRLYQADKAGHTGSLDPLATGLLPICLGQATKLCGYLLDSDKRYSVRAKLGERTDSADADGKVVETSDASRVSRADLEAVLPRFAGDIRQRPPMYSALKHQGRRLYELARAGQEVERKERAVQIHELRPTGFEAGFFELEVRCSKGTYIRTLVEDIAAAVQQCAHVTVLRRLEAASFYQPRMLSLEILMQAAGLGTAALDAFLLPSISALAGWPKVRVDGACALNLSHGQAVRAAQAPAAGKVAIMDESGALLGIGEINPDGLVAPRRWLS